MTRNRGISRNLTIAAIFLLLEVAAVAILRSTDSLQSVWLSRASGQVKVWLWGGTTKVKSYFALKEKNSQLEEENARLWDELRRYRALERQGELASLSTLDDKYECVVAQVIQLSTNSQRNYFIIDKGSADGVQAHSGVVTAHGVVGVVDIVNKKYSFGRTLMNPDISVSVRLGRHGLSGTLTWDGVHNDGAVLHGIPLHKEVIQGDTVRTSGYSNLFPPDIVLGTVTGTKVRNGSSKDVIVNLFRDFSTLEYVYVLKNADLDEIRELEQEVEL